jgi:hypothetical protein
MRLRGRIEACAVGKYQATEFEGTPPGIILRSIDFRKQRSSFPCVHFLTYARRYWV